MVDYDSARATGLRLIGGNGRSVTFVAPGENTGTSYDPEYLNPIETPAVALQTKFTTNEIDGSLIKARDKKFLIPAVYIEAAFAAGGPIESQKLKDGSIEYSIVNGDKLKPGEISILTKVQCRI